MIKNILLSFFSWLLLFFCIADLFINSGNIDFFRFFIILLLLVMVIPVFHENIGDYFYANSKYKLALLNYYLSGIWKRETLIKTGKTYLNLNNYYRALSIFLYLSNKKTEPEINLNIGIIYHEIGKIDLAIEKYNQVLRDNPYNSEAFTNLGMAYLEKKDIKNAMKNLDDGYRIRRGTEYNLNQKKQIIKSLPVVITLHKLKHDIEQIQYLLEKRLLATEFSETLNLYKKIFEEKKHLNDFYINISSEDSKKISSFYNRNVFFLPPKKIDKPVINPLLDIEKINESYKKADFKVVFFDDFLIPEAMSALYNFCLTSTIWHEDSKPEKYLGSYVDDGFNSGLLFQIAYELEKLFPEIFYSNPVKYIWSYKYENQGEGIQTHADSAKVNLNFWITPDSANLDKESGGLIVYDAEAPDNWDFENYNINTNKINSYIEKNMKEKLIVPYRQNRAVLFDSKLFHVTDRYNFKEGYENRRINITMLFGNDERKLI